MHSPRKLMTWNYLPNLFFFFFSFFSFYFATTTPHFIFFCAPSHQHSIIRRLLIINIALAKPRVSWPFRREIRAEISEIFSCINVHVECVIVLYPAMMINKRSTVETCEARKVGFTKLIRNLLRVDWNKKCFTRNRGACFLCAQGWCATCFVWGEQRKNLNRGRSIPWLASSPLKVNTKRKWRSQGSLRNQKPWRR